MRERYGDNPDMLAVLDAGGNSYETEAYTTRKTGSPAGQSGSARHDAATVDQ